AVSRAVRKRAPVHLGLLTRGGFEPHGGLAGRHPPAERPDEVLEDGVSTGVPLLPDFAQKDDAVVYSLTQTVHDILLVGVQLGRAPGTGLPGQGAVRIPQVAANCVPGDSQCLGDFSDRLFPLQLKDGFHFPTLQQSITPPTLAGIGSVFAGGWVNSFPPFMGQFITADHRPGFCSSRFGWATYRFSPVFLLLEAAAMCSGWPTTGFQLFLNRAPWAAWGLPCWSRSDALSISSPRCFPSLESSSPFRGAGPSACSQRWACSPSTLYGTSNATGSPSSLSPSP